MNQGKLLNIPPDKRIMNKLEKEKKTNAEKKETWIKHKMDTCNYCGEFAVVDDVGFCIKNECWEKKMERED